MMKTSVFLAPTFLLALCLLADSAPRKKSPLPEVKTLAFFDLETTGLIEAGKPSPRIIEYSVVTISRDDFLDSIEETHQNVLNGQPKSNVHPDYIVPHHMKNQSQVIDPEQPISEFISNLTKITPEMIIGKPIFSQFAPDMWKFLLDQSKPIVMIAHNGARFDFKVLMSELMKANSLEGISQVYTIDSIYSFKNIDKKWNKTKVATDDQSSQILPGKNKLMKFIDNFASGKETTYNYKLASLHKRFFDGLLPPGHHGALADCLSLMQVAAQYGEDFVQEIQQKMKLLGDVISVEGKKPGQEPSPAA